MQEYSDKILTPALGNHVPQSILTQTDWPARKILLVENEEGQCLLYEQELREEGYHVLCARTGKEALKCLEESLCDLVILDIRMPEMDGIEVLGKMVSRYKKMPVILHTAYAHYKNDFMTWLADAFVVKSSDLSVLKKTVRELLMKRGE
ncbi:MAG: response regulator [Syntrophaceae bacterium]|nr:response regulator [Syntrophaceae bacterium]